MKTKPNLKDICVNCNEEYGKHTEIDNECTHGHRPIQKRTKFKLRLKQ